MKKINIKWLPHLIFLIGIFVVAYLFFSNTLFTSQNTTPRASSAANLNLSGKIVKLENCIDSYLCFDLIEDKTGTEYHLYSKRFPKITSKDFCLNNNYCQSNNSLINLDQFNNINVNISGLYVKGPIPYLIIIDIIKK